MEAFGEAAGGLADEPLGAEPSVISQEAAPGADWTASTLVERFGDAAFEPSYALIALAALVLTSAAFAAIRGFSREFAALAAALAVALRGAGAAWPALDDATAWLGLDAAIAWVIDETSPFSETIHIIKQASGGDRP